MVQQIVHEANLAWALAQAAKPYLSANERDEAFVAIGAGETFAAIRQLFRSVAVKRIPLGPDLLQQCRTWLYAYRGHEDERDLRRLIEEPLIPYVVRVPETIWVAPVPATPKPVRLGALAGSRDTQEITRSSGSGCNTGGFARRPERGHDDREPMVRIASRLHDREGDARSHRDQLRGA
jgi:hypothetical protein